MADQKRKLRKCKVCEDWLKQTEESWLRGIEPGPPPEHVDWNKTPPSMAQCGAWILKCGRNWLT